MPPVRHDPARLLRFARISGDDALAQALARRLQVLPAAELAFRALVGRLGLGEARPKV